MIIIISVVAHLIDKLFIGCFLIDYFVLLDMKGYPKMKVYRKVQDKGRNISMVPTKDVREKVGL